MGPKKKGAGRGSGGSAPPSDQDNAPRPPAPPQRIVVGPYAPPLSPSDRVALIRSIPPRAPRAYTPPLLGPQQGAPPADSGSLTPPPGFNVAAPQVQQPVGARPAGPPRPAMRPPPAYNPLGPRPPVQAANPAPVAPVRPRPPQQPSAPNLRVMLPAEVTAAQGIGKLQLQEQAGAGTAAESSVTPRTTMQPTTGKDIPLALRPGFGTLGRPIPLKANFFKAACSKETFFHYDVVISPDTDKTAIRRAVIRELVRTHRSTTLANALPTFDGSKSLYTARPLPFHSREFTDITPPDEVPLPPPPPGQPAREPRRFKVTLSIVANINMESFKRFLEARSLELPQTSIQVLDIVMREKALLSNVPVGRSFFNENVDRPVNLSGGLVAWRGYYQSMRPTQGGLMLNLDMSASAFHKPINVIDYIPEVVPRWSGATLGDADRVKLGKALVGVRFEVTHRGEMRRRHRIMGITRKAARDLKFLYNGEEISVEGYFLQAYNYRLRHPGLQCFEVGAKKDVLIPMEVCRIVGGQRYPRKLSDTQVLELLRIVQQKPADRKRLTESMVARNDYGRDEYAREFGLTISKDMSDVQGRVLNPPTVVYKEMNQKDKLYQPRDGAWNLRSTCLYSGVNIDRWAVLSFVSRRMQSAVANFATRLASKCNEMGMNMNPATLLPVEDWLVGDNAFSSPREMTAALKAVTSQAHRTDPQGLQLLICVFPSKEAQPYGTLKRVCETEIGVVTQCCLARHVQKSDPQYLANVVLKINVKVKAGDGEAPAINNLLSKELQGKLPFINEDKVPTIIFGADVTHPQPGERDEGTSVAAIVASQDWPYVNRYEALVSAQPGTEEIIQNAEGMFRDHLIAFYRKTGQKPKRIIMYRDGVSEGQFYQVLLHELRALWKTCAKLEPDYKPNVTWIVCQKRHKTRLYCANEHQADRSGNVPAGTVVDQVITHPSQFDFYLNSHTGLKGTSRPCHYHVLYDQNSFTADAIQDLTNSLCYTFARCTRSVSLAPPAYYAHLAAFRARFYMDSAENDRGSVSSGSSGRREAGRAPYRLPAIKEALHGTMFFC